MSETNSQVHMLCWSDWGKLGFTLSYYKGGWDVNPVAYAVASLLGKAIQRQGPPPLEYIEDERGGRWYRGSDGNYYQKLPPSGGYIEDERGGKWYISPDGSYEKKD